MTVVHWQALVRLLQEVQILSSAQPGSSSAVKNPLYMIQSSVLAAEAVGHACHGEGSCEVWARLKVSASHPDPAW